MKYVYIQFCYKALTFLLKYSQQFNIPLKGYFLITNFIIYFFTKKLTLIKKKNHKTKILTYKSNFMYLMIRNHKTLNQFLLYSFFLDIFLQINKYFNNEKFLTSFRNP